MNALTLVLFASLLVLAATKPIIVGSSGVVSAAGASGPSGIVTGRGAIGPVGVNPAIVGVGIGIGGGEGIDLVGGGIRDWDDGIELDGARVGDWDDGRWDDGSWDENDSGDWDSDEVGIVGGHGLVLDLDHRW